MSSALQRFGSATQGDPLYRAADHLGSLLRTLFLCDYFSNIEFSREIHTLLNCGESVDQLQRAIYTGEIVQERGRRRDELIVTSGSLRPLTCQFPRNVAARGRIVKRFRKAVMTCLRSSSYGERCAQTGSAWRGFAAARIHAMIRSSILSSQLGITGIKSDSYTGLTYGSELMRTSFDVARPGPRTLDRHWRQSAHSLNMEKIMNYIINILSRSGLMTRDLDYHLIRAAMVIIFAWFGYDKWFDVEITGLLPLITHGPLIFWMPAVLGVGGTSILLGTAEWTFGSLLFLGYWNKKLGVLGALGSTFSFIATFSIFPFAPGAWEHAAGGFPAMTIVSAFLLKDLVLLVVSVYLLKQDVARVMAARGSAAQRDTSPLRKLKV